jgi:hypothetical protein
MNHLPPSPENNTKVILKLFEIAEIFVSQGAPPVSTTPVANFATSPLVLLMPVANLPLVSTTQVENSGKNIRPLTT